MRDRTTFRFRLSEFTGCAGCIVTLAAALLCCSPALGCNLPAQGEGRVSAILDGRTLRLDDGREVRLAGIELLTSASERRRAADALTALLDGASVTLHGNSDAPDRYGRQSALVYRDGSDTPVQTALLEQGAAMMSPSIDATCLPQLRTAENAARQAWRGIWASGAAIKNTERPGDILAAIGQFGVVEGKVLSVRQAGSITYVNFGRRWTQDFALTISKPAVAAFEDAKIPLKSLENRKIRARGWIGQRGGPRIEVLKVEQVDVLSEAEPEPGRGRVRSGSQGGPPDRR
jgi:endonuclease YncB( thermonuclease family)